MFPFVPGSGGVGVSFSLDGRQAGEKTVRDWQEVAWIIRLIMRTRWIHIRTCSRWPLWTGSTEIPVNSCTFTFATGPLHA